MVRIGLATILSLCIATNVSAKQVIVSGSTSVARVMDVLAETYNNQHPDDFVAVQGIGSTAGVTMVINKVADLGMTSRYLTEGESDQKIQSIRMAADGLAVVVNPENPVQNLTQKQLADIYQGKITNWKEVGGNDLQIAVVTREVSSGTRYSFESLLGLTTTLNGQVVSDINPTNLVVNSNSMVKTLVNHNRQAIGFVSMGSIDRSIKAIDVAGIHPTTDNVVSRKYPLYRPFLLITRQDDVNENAQKFIDFVLSKQGQTLIEQYGYTPVSSKL